MATATTIGGRGWTRLHALGRGGSGAVVSLAADDASRELFVVKSATGDNAALRREWRVMSGLSSPHVIRCLGFRRAVAAGGEDQLFLEFAPGGSLAAMAGRDGGRGLKEGAVRAYAADVLRGLAYLHGRGVLHGDVKGSNVVVSADGRAKLADFGCATTVRDWPSRAFEGTPAFMAPEVARGEAQGPAADVWALGCTVVEIATGRAPWRDADNVLAAVRTIGYTDAVPEVAPSMSPESKDFLDKCFRRHAADRWTAAQLLEHPFVATPCALKKQEEEKATWVSPTSALDAALWESESESDNEAFDMLNGPVARIKAMASSRSSLPDWDSENGWIKVNGVSVSIVHDRAAADDESLACLDNRVRALACPPLSVPDWDFDEGWIEACRTSSAHERSGTVGALHPKILE
ncbi:mitogen-activated protein kinase kinase kinase 17-like [Phragmites australis]|uniref:mitogen-activated protein kinase kinase kinase 17-like n=1 Tax=Phragmites australis TaxID=29695 RepID=UPI002D770BEE|nr:mitogen-activated protein kinase kinase kinase 17-like [Phragmites australis]